MPFSYAFVAISGSDVFKRVSGTTGLAGSADATFVLEKEHRATDTAALYAIGMDIEYQEFTLRFRNCSWELVERKSQEQLAAAGVIGDRHRAVDANGGSGHCAQRHQKAAERVPRHRPAAEQRSLCVPPHQVGAAHCFFMGGRR